MYYKSALCRIQALINFDTDAEINPLHNFSPLSRLQPFEHGTSKRISTLQYCLTSDALCRARACKNENRLNSLFVYIVNEQKFPKFCNFVSREEMDKSNYLL